MKLLSQDNIILRRRRADVKSPLVRFGAAPEDDYPWAASADPRPDRPPRATLSDRMPMQIRNVAIIAHVDH
ncbi:MAG TPA: hypothetical protein PLQ13_14760, partial [Candidatus Krumholzibacteria bacterium]|nr:hypothetical protein [Candidatus Krumholzibacteria bacterium]